MGKCNGPCLEHCYDFDKSNTILLSYFTCGLIVGILLVYLFRKYKDKIKKRNEHISFHK